MKAGAKPHRPPSASVSAIIMLLRRTLKTLLQQPIPEFSIIQGRPLDARMIDTFQYSQSSIAIQSFKAFIKHNGIR